MNKPIQELVTKWKNQQDKQIQKFESLGEIIKNFELVVTKNIETVILF